MAPVTRAGARAAARPAASVDLAVGALLALMEIERLGPGRVHALLERYGDPVSALEAAPGAKSLSGSQRKELRARLGGRPAHVVAGEAAAAAAAELGPGDRILGYGRPGYPSRLERLHFPPPVLWARGPLPAAAPRTVAIVGTRAATRPARLLAREIAADLAAWGVRVVSGLAAGIDGEAHRGALEASGETVAVLGSGLRFRYPASNHDLYDRLRRDGLVLTEFAPRVRPEPHHFPRRNRIVAALADAVLVVQAGRRSGALLTAGEAAEIGVEVLACPGDPRLAGSAGCHDLLRDGAGLVTCADDVLEALGWSSEDDRAAAGGDPAGFVFTEAERALVERLEREPALLDELAELAGGVGAAAVLLARLEIAGVIRGLPGGRFERIRPRRPAAEASAPAAETSAPAEAGSA